MMQETDRTGLSESLHLRECGLKSHLVLDHQHTDLVAPLVGAWIEMPQDCRYHNLLTVAPLVGEQIEFEIIIKNNIPAVINE